MSALIGIETLIITVIVLILSAGWSLYEKRKYYSSVTSKLPTLYGIPFIGHAYQFINLNKLYRNISLNIDTFKQLTGCLWVANTAFIVTVDPEVIKHVTTSPIFLNKATDLYKHFHNGVINGLVVSPAKKWKINRKAITPFLAHNNIMAFFTYFNENAINMKNRLTKLAGQGEQDIFTIIKECGLQLSLLTIMGIKMEEDDETYRGIVDAFNVLLDLMAKNSIYSSVGLGFLSNTPQYNRYRELLRDFVRSLIKQNLSRKNDSEAKNNFEEDKQTMIDLALKSLRQGVFSEKDVEIECFTMIAASYETSVSAAYTCLMTLAMHPEIQERVFQEICSVFPNGIITVEYDDLKNLPYFDMCIADALRLAPPIPYIGREAIHDTELCPGLKVPKNMQVVIPIYELHRRKEIWGPDAHHFNPDNFLPENIAKRHPSSYMVFSKGPRNCIGFRYAEISLRIILLHALRNLKFSTTFRFEDIVHQPKVTLSYKVEPPISIEIRAN
ncbi:probable cytochrome P450 313a4 [Bactrocera dorsalis]|uniref:Probable cytochrome P450 313a4 n=1 Tax=Bactrocera dorsalis TaxID=27457 RepID=A0ABM3J3N9_BACDO|nr:probable cytochrome P450 313a4 [Bactrocera dorsalis]